MAGPTDTSTMMKVYDFLTEYLATHQRPPTLAEIARATQCGSLCTARRHLIRLRRLGLVSWEWHEQGTLRICKQ